MRDHEAYYDVGAQLCAPEVKMEAVSGHEINGLLAGVVGCDGHCLVPLLVSREVEKLGRDKYTLARRIPLGNSNWRRTTARTSSTGALMSMVVWKLCAWPMVSEVCASKSEGTSAAPRFK